MRLSFISGSAHFDYMKYKLKILINIYCDNLCPSGFYQRRVSRTLLRFSFFDLTFILNQTNLKLYHQKIVTEISSFAVRVIFSANISWLFVEKYFWNVFYDISRKFQEAINKERPRKSYCENLFNGSFVVSGQWTSKSFNYLIFFCGCKDRIQLFINKLCYFFTVKKFLIYCFYFVSAVTKVNVI